MSDSSPDIMLLTRPECHLCAAARTTVARVCAEHGVAWREVSTTEEPALGERHSEEIPVLFIDGVQRDFWSIDADRLARLITAARTARQDPTP
ncbi:glutaredoxin family protein [Citricoccus muralis]|uniref:Glutaredoxin family protein n=1 Tax=Citricoccus muralis TaxID=169134 RepID=A0ABY8H4P1_9MICC|nr:glutaredoxin family protein [Citricoccus muralis]WFP15976.1 glutaredoxin family protein [Citricoccus muralis]